MSVFSLAALSSLGTAGALTSIFSGTALAQTTGSLPITKRNLDVSRVAAAESPKGVEQQAVVNGWPLYRSDRGQEAFNHAMATLRATTTAAPTAAAFQGCRYLRCRLDLPKLTSSGWIPAGRLWISPNDYMLIVHSPRPNKRERNRRRSRKSMRYFVFHEFQNSTLNVDPYDTISAHKRSVFVPFYLGKPGVDAQGHNYIPMIQVAPHDVVSVHASNMGNAGPGIEVAKNSRDRLGHLQALAGALVATIVKRAEPQLRVVNHRGREGRPMLQAYRLRLAAERGKPSVRLPFVPAKSAQVAQATGRLEELIVHAGLPQSRVRVARRPKNRPGEKRLPTLRPALTASAAAIPQLVSAPRLIRVARQPFRSIEQLLSYVSTPLIPPRPRRACLTAPGYVC